MTCVYICGLHLNNDSLREGEEDVETVMGMGERKVARKREVRRHLLVLKKKKKWCCDFILNWLRMQTEPLGSFPSQLSDRIRGWKKS